MEFSNKRAAVFDRMWRLQLGDDDVFASSCRPDAAVFWRWLASAMPKSLVECLEPPITASTEIMEFYQFELTLLMLIGELLKVCNHKERATSLPRAQRDPQQANFVYVDTIRHGRNYTPTKTINELSSFVSSLKEGPRTLHQVQEFSPDIAYCPFDQSHDWKAHNRSS